MRENISSPCTGIKSVAVIGNYLPRKCGIATFTRDLVESLSAEAGNSDCWTIAMNDRKEGYRYPGNVRFEINENDPADYRKAAEFIKSNQTDMVCLQHEYGIFGGPAGSYILELLRELHVPVVTTLHTILTEPDKEHDSVMKQVAGVSDKLVVMSRRAADILKTVYGIDNEKIVYIPHGNPDIPFLDPNYNKDQFGLLGKKVMMTFGLLSRNKGIEYVLKALPKVIDRFPDLVYLVLGVTHPNVVKHEGENYREDLRELVEKLGLSNHVDFQNRFVSTDELCEYLAASDLYITPYIDEAQITSGTLSYAMGTGKAVISTPYWYAEEMLADGRGLLVPFKDSESISDAIIHLLENDASRQQMRIRAYDFSRQAIWKEVARRYMEVFRDLRQERDQKPAARLSSISSISSNGTVQKSFNGNDYNSSGRMKLPFIKFDHLLALTDDTGLLQHASYTVANRDHGYCTDDNARALIVAAMARKIPQTNTSRLDELCHRYLSFLLHALDSGSGRFRNFMAYDRRWTEQVGSEDSHGRAIWALGLAVSLLEQYQQTQLASTCFAKSIKAAGAFQSPRAIAFTLIGMDSYLNVYPGHSEARRSFKKLAERLFDLFTENAVDGWPWPEDMLTYANGKLPHALLLAGQRLKRDDMVQAGLKSLKWLLDIQTGQDHAGQDYLVPVGNQGWYTRGSKKARFDQQPIEANALIEACIAAFQVNRDRYWLDQATMCFRWYLGQNDLHLPLYDVKTGGCRDGLESDGVNQNEGAESTLSWMLSLAALHLLSADHVIRKTEKRKPSELITRNL
ncbi:MAG: glycosyltransferase family 4 protein [Balneolaceae bacterium]